MIDLRSDTVTKPSAAMREAARDAEVGDDVHEDDPTVKELEAAAADKVGMEAALFVPSGTMGNQAAIRTHTDRGQEVIVDRQAHVYKYEVGGLAQLGSLQVRPVDADRGIPTPAEVEAAFVAEDIHRPGTGLLTLENTHNSRGGLAIAPAAIEAAADAAHDRGIPVHLDGARMFNAAVARDVPITAITDPVDSVMFCLSKGLGAPVGSIVAGSEPFITRVRRTRKLLGGGMRQAGLIAAPGLLALENVDRLATDHSNADRLADGLDDLPGLSVTPPETNIVLVDVTDTGHTAASFIDVIADHGVQASEFGEYTVRFCTHLDVDREDIDVAIDRVESTL
ncbi:MAG: low-specificity L-threonine aldolase [Halobacteriaceae archaeon]